MSDEKSSTLLLMSEDGPINKDEEEQVASNTHQLYKEHFTRDKRKRKERGKNRFHNIETELQKRLMEYASQQLGTYHCIANLSGKFSNGPTIQDLLICLCIGTGNCPLCSCPFTASFFMKPFTTSLNCFYMSTILHKKMVHKVPNKYTINKNI